MLVDQIDTSRQVSERQRREHDEIRRALPMDEMDMRTMWNELRDERERVRQLHRMFIAGATVAAVLSFLVRRLTFS